MRARLHHSLSGADVAGGSLNGGHIAANSLTGAHIFDGTLTGADVFGKSLTGANIADNTLTGAHVADKSLGGGKLADNTLTGAQIDESSLGSVPQAGNAALLGGLPASTFGTAVRSAVQPADGDYILRSAACARVNVTVPQGRTYDVIIWSTISAFHTDPPNNKSLVFCPAADFSNRSVDCVTASGDFEDGISLAPNYSESGAAVGFLRAGEGNWTFSTKVRLAFGSTNGIGHDATQNVHTTVLLSDSVPGLPVDPPNSSGSSGTSGQSSGGESTSSSSGETDNP